MSSEWKNISEESLKKLEHIVEQEMLTPEEIRDNLEVLFRYKEGRAQWTYVHTSLANSREYVVEANRDRSAELDPGDLIIVSGNLNLADGSEVTLTDNR